MIVVRARTLRESTLREFFFLLRKMNESHIYKRRTVQACNNKEVVSRAIWFPEHSEGDHGSRIQIVSMATRQSAHIVKMFIFVSDSIYHPINFCKRKIRFG